MQQKQWRRKKRGGGRNRNARKRGQRKKGVGQNVLNHGNARKSRGGLDHLEETEGIIIDEDQGLQTKENEGEGVVRQGAIPPDMMKIRGRASEKGTDRGGI
jgi:hypothetical protein